MKLFRVTYVQELHPFAEHEVYMLCDGLPGYKQILKRINMLDYCGKEMSDKGYKEFVISLGNYTKYNIEKVEEVKFVTF